MCILTFAFNEKIKSSLYAVVDIQIQGPEAKISENLCSLKKKRALISSFTFFSQNQGDL